MADLTAPFRNAFRPLKARNFRLYMGGQAVSLVGTAMQATAQAWVVWSLSQSAAALGVVTMLGTLPLLLLGPWTGAWADRLNRRRLLIVTQALAMVLAASLAVLVSTGLVRLWHVYVLATLLGCVNALDMPAQQAFIGDLVGMGEVRSAISVNAMALQVSRMAGPAFSGWLIGWAGVAPAFWLNALSFGAVIASLMAVTARLGAPRTSTGRPLQAFAEGLRYITSAPRMQDLLILTGLLTVFCLSNLQLLPAFTTLVLHDGPAVLGQLQGAMGAGALTSVLFVVPSAQAARRTGVTLAGAVLWTGVWYAVLALSHVAWLAAFALFATGLGVPVLMTAANGLLQIMAPDAMRARLMSAWMMVSLGLQPFAAMLTGYSAQRLGVSTAILVNGLVAVTGTIALVGFRQGLRRWEI